MRTVARTVASVGVALLCCGACPARAMSALSSSADDAVPLPAPDAPALETREFHIPTAFAAAPVPARQEIVAWQVTQGSWNGQTLAGLSLILVHSTPFDPRLPTHTNCYISQEATSAQRSALLDAFLASNPQAVPAQDVSSMRIEPATIKIQFDGHAVTLHLGRIA